MTAVLAAFPHLEVSPWPSYSPQRQVIERFWNVLRRRATHNRLLPTIAQLQSAWRHRRSYYHTLTHRVLSLIQSSRNRTKAVVA
jgi:hypothetical protein